MNGEDLHHGGKQNQVYQRADERLRDEEVVECEENQIDEREVGCPLLGNSYVYLPNKEVALRHQRQAAQDHR